VIYRRAGYVQFTVSLIASLHHCIHYSLAFFLYEVAGSSARDILSQYTPVPLDYHPYIVIPPGGGILDLPDWESPRI
jgi:hypothetical protein